MKKLSFYICLIFIAIGCLSFLNPSDNVSFADTQPTVVQISSLNDVCQQQNFEKSFQLTGDIDVSQDVWTSIGYSNGSYTSFKGELDGNGYTIKGLKLDNSQGGFNIGLFGILENATIKNLKIQIEVLNCQDVSDITTLYVGGIAGQIKSSKIENCVVEFSVSDTQNNFVIANKNDDQSYFGITNSVCFGGIAGTIDEGTQIKNCTTDTTILMTKDGQRGKMVNIGGVVGVCNYSTILNTISKLKNTCEVQGEVQETIINIGGLSGTVCGNNSQIQNCYAQAMSDIQSLSEIVFGSVAGSINLSFAPKAKNINFVYTYAQNKQNGLQQNYSLIGKLNQYSVTDCQMQILSESDYSVFTDPTLWNSDIMWDFEDTWSATGNDVPTLQVFKTYIVDLNANPMVDFGLLSVSDQNVSTIQFDGEDDQVSQKQYKYGETVKVKIKIADGFKKYFDLDTISVANSIVFNSKSPDDYNQNYVVEKPDNDLQKDFYLLSYRCFDGTAGQVSFSLFKIQYSLNVMTENSLMGMVKNQFSSSSLDQFSQSITYGNKYTFLPVSTSNDFAFYKWCFEKDDQSIDLASDSSSFTFIFGEEQTNEDLNQYIIDGFELVAHWTSNVCKITVQVKNGENILTEGYVLKNEDGIELEDTFSVQKGMYKISVELDENYQLDGWYSLGRLIGNNLQLETETEGEELVLVLKVVKIQKSINLTWLWITLGCLGGVGIIAVIVVIIVKKSKDKGYKNFY